MSNSSLRTKYRLLVALIGITIIILAALKLPPGRVSIGLPVLAAIIVFTAALAIQSPGSNSRITVSDTVIYLTLLLYGGEAGVIIAALDGVCSSLRISKKPLTVVFNSSVMAVSIFAPVSTLLLVIGPVDTVSNAPVGRLVGTLCAIALVHYFLNSSLIAIDRALQTKASLWLTWRDHYLWTSLTYFFGAFAAALVARSIARFGFFPVLLTIPIVAMVYFTYRTYMNSVDMANRQAEQATLHVEEQRLHITDLKMIERELHDSREHFKRASLHDRLTGLPNRALLTDRLDSAIEKARLNNSYRFALMFVDLDRFKIVNDTLGHQAGDELLMTISRRLQDCVSEHDTVARLGGDEFAVVVDAPRDLRAVTQLAANIQRLVCQPFFISNHECSTSASIGIVMSSESDLDRETLLRNADNAMYQAKQNGKARHEVFDREMKARVDRRLKLENDLRQAVQRQQFYVCYQPVVSLAEQGQIVGVEALLRWRHPERGDVFPEEFMPLAEEIGFSADLGRWMIRDCCEQISEWCNGQTPRYVSLGLSASQFNDPALLSCISNTLSETNIDPSLLHLEVTESVLMRDPDSSLKTIRRLKSLRVHITIDQFGSGYSTLSQLPKLAINSLKIDKEFVATMEGENLSVVKAIITLATALGLEVVAEGVQTNEQEELLRDLKCGEAQGKLLLTTERSQRKLSGPLPVSLLDRYHMA